MIIHVLIIFALGCLAYWATNRAPITAPRIKQVALIAIVVITALLMLGAATGHDFIPGLS